MNTRFRIDDLRTLVARALQTGDYSPAESKRIRAVPDTRTIRYYTTLGLIDRPAEMQGRVALYEPRHVMQVVAIKRLQAANQTLSDIQERLIGIQTKQLKRLADLPEDFWETAERYLSRKQKLAPEVTPPKSEGREFWNESPAMPEAFAPHQPAGESMPFSLPRATRGASDAVRPCLCWEPLAGVRILLDHAANDSQLDMQRLRDAAIPLLNELIRQGLLSEASLPPEVT